ncbi:MAG: ribonuclease E/G [Defluviimonas sp.]|nr:ribonuclease E/G [Paracoccaceae bacterium]MCC0062641.1 ribonuclease E/G [Defluviimonas sp.]
MKGRMIVLGRYRGREAAARLVDGRLEDLILDPGEALAFAPGAILRATVDRQMKGQGGAFVRLPGGERGFLRETRGIAPGQSLIVQIAGVAEAGKAAPVTLRLLFKGRLAIVTPMAPGLNISRRIRETEVRARLERIAERSMAGAEAGLILRSAAEAAAEEEIAEEIATLRSLAEAIAGDSVGPRELLLDAPGPHEEAWRDWSDPAPAAVDQEDGAFARHGIDEMIAQIGAASVRLAGGGEMAIETTRALVAVDVNTGSDSSPAAGLRANIEAARELPRQLRLRGLGGMVVIDAAPMPKRDRAAFEQQLRAAFRGDAGDTALAGWTPLGNYELQRRRDRLPLARLMQGDGA